MFLSRQGRDPRAWTTPSTNASPSTVEDITDPSEENNEDREHREDHNTGDARKSWNGGGHSLLCGRWKVLRYGGNIKW